MKMPELRPSALAAAVLLLCGSYACADESPKALPAPAVDETKVQPGGTETAVLSGGCFWGMQGVFEHVRGIRHVVAGYSGGAGVNPSYEEVSTGTTGHAESVKIAFDPGVITYGQILRVYFSVAHDPTELNRQGPDSGTQYRSNIFYLNDAQQRIARAYIAQLSQTHAFREPIVTRIDRISGFYTAEAYHQDYLIHNPDSIYILVNDLPKIASLKSLYPALYTASPAKVADTRL